MSQRHKLRGNELGKLRLYQQLMSMEFSLLTAYVVLFLAAESIALALAALLKDVGKSEHLGIIAITSIVIGIGFLMYLYSKANEVERWKNKILELTQGTDMEDDFKAWERWWFLGLRWVGDRTALIWAIVWTAVIFILLLLGWYVVLKGTI